MTTIPTFAQIELMTIAQMTAFWNAHCAKVQRTLIKKFTDKAQGIKRCEELAQFLRSRPAKSQKVTAQRITVSAVARELILAGKDNKEVWTALVEQFRLDETKKHYPAWYRAELRRKGEKV